MSRRRGTLTLRREDGRIVCDSVTVADSAARRLRGLLGRRTLSAGEGIVLRPAWSIHTAFMRFSIDVVFIDAEQVVMRVEHGLRPFKTASCRSRVKKSGGLSWRSIVLSRSPGVVKTTDSTFRAGISC